MSEHRRTLLRVAVAAFVVLVASFFVVAIVDAWGSTHGRLPSVWRVSTAVLACALGLLAGAYAWATLLGGDRRIDRGATLLVAQLGKYVPGGVWQATGQVGLARSTGVRIQRGATAFWVFAIVQTAAGCAWVLLLAIVWSDAPLGGRILLGIVSVASVGLIDRRWMVWVLHRIPRTRAASSELVAGQRPIVLAWFATFGALGAATIGYLLTLGSFGPIKHPWLVIGGYAAAWTVGFVAFPIPSGIGVREAVLIGLLHGSFPASVVVAASVYYRLISIATEGVMAAIAAHRVRPSRLRALLNQQGEDRARGPSEARHREPE